MVMNSEAHQKITTAHLSRLAYLYVRQSTLRQVFENTTPRVELSAPSDGRDVIHRCPIAAKS